MLGVYICVIMCVIMCVCVFDLLVCVIMLFVKYKFYPMLKIVCYKYKKNDKITKIFIKKIKKNEKRRSSEELFVI